MNIEALIKDLFIETSRVVIPGLGTLYSQYQKALIKPRQKTMLPPGNTIGFNPNLKSDLDSILELYINRKTNINLTEVSKQLAQFVSDILKRLNDFEKVPLSNLGYFYKNQQTNQICFQNEIEGTSLPESFGLASIDIEPILILDEEKRTSMFLKKGNLIRVLYWLIPSVLVVFFGIILFINFNKNKSSENKSKPETQLVIKTKKESNSSAVDQKLDSNFTAATKTKTALHYEEEKMVNAVLDSVVNNTEARNSDKYYYIIAGSFTNEKNARRFYDKLLKTGYHPDILNPDTNIYRVSLNKYTSLHDAVKELDQLKSGAIEYNVWISTR